MPRKKHVITAAMIRKAADRLRRADAKRRCHFCNRLKPDGFTTAIVSIHMKCADKQNEEIKKLLGPRNTIDES